MELEFDSSSSTKTEPFSEFSTFINKLSPILNEMKESIEIADLPAMASLETEYERAKEAIQSQTVVSSPAKHINFLIQNLGRSLGLVLFASHDVPLSNKQKIESLCKEMMNVRFDSSSQEFSNYDETEEITEEKTEETTLGIDDIVWQIKHGSEENVKTALMGLNALIMDDDVVSSDEEDLIKVLSCRFRSSKGGERAIVIRILRYLTLQKHENKEKMRDLEFLTALVKSLARDVEEQREAVGLLLNLSDNVAIRRSIGRVQGCIVMLVAISNGDDEMASHDATLLLNALSSNAQHALHMAEAAYFKPLINYLKEGSDMSKILMATALSRLELTDQNKATLGQNGAIQPLVKMFNTGNLEAKLSALNALQNLSNSKPNIQILIDSGIVTSLLQLLFSVTSIQMTLREPASSILAKVAQSESILVKHDVAQQMLSLLNLSSPVIQNNLLEALNNIVLHSSASKVRKKMKDNRAIHLLFPMLSDNRMRLGALKLIYVLTEDLLQEEIEEQIGYENIAIIANIIISSSSSDCEKAAAFGVLSNLPVNDGKITDILKNVDLLPFMVSFLSSSPGKLRACLDERIAGILIRFTIPTNKKLQHYSVENGVFHLLLRLLTSTSEMAKSRAALCLAQLSHNTLSLKKSRKKWLCMPYSIDSHCEVHDGYCSIKSTFCLVKANCITPLVQILEGDERGADEAVLSCFSTLLQDEIWENGCKYLVKKSGIDGVIKVLSFGSVKAREKALWILERVFRVEAYREEYGECAQVVLIELTQNGDPMLKPIVAKLLAQLELLQVQSSYF